MKKKKEDSKKKLMANFKKHGGGTKVDPEFTAKNPEGLRRELQKSFDENFPELIKASKYRKHVIFDEDVFQLFDELAGESSSKFSSMINSALRFYLKEKLNNKLKEKDPVAELLIIRERERELIKKIKELDLVKEFQK